MDAAAMHLALDPAGAPPQARLVLRAGFTALQDIARVVGIRFESDPLPDASVQLTFEEFAEGVERVTAAGFRVERSAEEAWPHYRGWRVNYESTAYTLARKVDAVPARWSGTRDWPSTPITTIRPPHRRPDAPHVAYPGDAAWFSHRDEKGTD
jgi:hypothetical protein